MTGATRKVLELPWTGTRWNGVNGRKKDVCQVDLLTAGAVRRDDVTDSAVPGVTRMAKLYSSQYFASLGSLGLLHSRWTERTLFNISRLIPLEASVGLKTRFNRDEFRRAKPSGKPQPARGAEVDGILAVSDYKRYPKQTEQKQDRKPHAGRISDVMIGSSSLKGRRQCHTCHRTHYEVTPICRFTLVFTILLHVGHFT